MKKAKWIFQNFFPWMLILHCLELVYSKNYFNFTKMFVLKLFKIVANQSTPGWNRSLSLNFWWLKSANYVKFTDVYGEACFNQKMFTYGLNIDLPLQAWIKKTVHEVETYCLLKKKFQVLQSVKEMMLTMFWDTD